MAYDINAALERLENNLAEVDSAKRQVEETIATSDSLQQTVGRYTKTLNDLNKEVSAFIEEVDHYHSVRTADLNSVVDDIKTSCENITTKFDAGVKTSTDTLNAEVSEAIAKLDSENAKFATEIARLVSLHDVLSIAATKVSEVREKVDTLAKYLKQSQDGQDETLDSVKSSLETQCASIKSLSEKISDDGEKRLQKVKTALKDISDKVSSAKQTLDSIISVQTETKGLCHGIKQDLERFRSDFDDSLAAVAKAAKINRWIIIIVFLLLVALHFIKG